MSLGVFYRRYTDMLTLGWHGEFRIKVNNEEEIIKNRVMDVALDELVKVLLGTAPDMELKYLAVGTSSTAVTSTDTQLGSELFRTQLTDVSKSATGEITSLAIILEAEAIGTIEEIGIFAGSTATSTADSGILVSRILWHRVKTSSDEIQFTRIDKVVRA
jgi:hypothetical protein